MIALYCLNLPSHLRFRPENVFIVGLIPPPHEPDVYTISHILEPLVITLNSYWPTPVLIPTPRLPNGAPVTVFALMLIADLLAIRKAGGFLSVKANFPCSYCLCPQDGIQGVDLIWEFRNPEVVRTQAATWRASTTKKEKESRATANGVRWTPLHDLPYWNPISQLLLGFMHNWLEGVLEEHLRTYLGIGRNSKLQKMLALLRTEEADDEVFTESEMSDSADELMDLERDMDDIMESSSLPPSSLTPSSSSHSTPTPQPVIEAPQTATELDFDDDDALDSDSSDEEFIAEAPGAKHKFSKASISLIHKCIEEIELPTHISRPPSNLGDAQHGKLKADEYLVLFTVILPLVLPDIWLYGNIEHTQPPELRTALFNNFCSLVASTHILSSYSTSPEEADRFAVLYRSYRKSSQTLFHGVASKPNHHYAMHYPTFLKFYGPLASLCELPGERLNGILGRISTNKHTGKRLRINSKLCLIFVAQVI